MITTRYKDFEQRIIITRDDVSCMWVPVKARGITYIEDVQNHPCIAGVRDPKQCFIRISKVWGLEEALEVSGVGGLLTVGCIDIALMPRELGGIVVQAEGCIVQSFRTRAATWWRKRRLEDVLIMVGRATLKKEGE